ncbi:MAG: HAMP domain-containing sensor histidine kinase [Eubacteriales bacterium]|nr:HAMP domain-containing sensor histidine kinase [Eubacteriales bacterium]
MNTLFFRNFVSSATLFCLSFILLGSSFLFISRRYFIDEEQARLAVNAEEVVKSAAAFSHEDDLQSWTLRMTISSISRSTGDHIFLCDNTGRIVTCSDMELLCPHIGQSISRDTIETIRTDGQLSLADTLDGFYEESHYIVALPIPGVDKNDDVSGYVFVSTDIASTLSAWDVFFPTFVFISLVVLLISILISLFYSKRLSNPLVALAEAATRFGRGDFSVRVQEEGHYEELDQLTLAFNSMAESLEKSEELRREFIANVSHELKTPMTTISGFADGLLDGTIPPENQDKYLSTISSETKRLSRLVRQMLDLSRLQAGQSNDYLHGSFDICEVLRRTLVNFVDKIESRGLDVNVQVPEYPITVVGDADAIMQVVYNLLDNAVKFALPGSTLDLSLWKQAGKAYVSVRNLGETIPEAELPLLFDRFHKTDRSRSRNRDGVGLGLYIVKTILNNHGENITVTSQNGVTEFVFTLMLR